MAIKKIIRRGEKRRSRSKQVAQRKAAVRGKRWSAAASLVGGFVFVSALGGLAMGEKGMSAIATVIKDPSSLLSSRSPGERSPGAKFSTKGMRQVAGTPLERSFGGPKSGGPGASAPGNGAPGGTEGAGVPDPSAFALTTPENPGPGTLGPSSVGDAPVVAGPVGNPPGAGPFVPVPVPGGNTPTPPVTPVTPVPEPSTWLMLIAGFFLTGFAIRRRKRAVSHELAVQPEARS